MVGGHYPKAVTDAGIKSQHEVPTGRFGTESEIAASVTFLLSPISSYVNGVTLKWVLKTACCLMKS
jgi:NAD(P)-dependent dehydrogenase (short-subunit alcohol dehydrogenase family)